MVYSKTDVGSPAFRRQESCLPWPGFEPGLSRPQREVLTTRLSRLRVRSLPTYLSLRQSQPFQAAAVKVVYSALRRARLTPYLHQLRNPAWFLHEALAWASKAGGRVPSSEKFGRRRSPIFENELAQIRCLFRFLGYFVVVWSHCRIFVPPVKNPWRRPWVLVTLVIGWVPNR